MTKRRFCALPGCEEVIETPDGERKYCSEEHRLAARRLRAQERMADEDTEDPDESEELDLFDDLDDLDDLEEPGEPAAKRPRPAKKFRGALRLGDHIGAGLLRRWQAVVAAFVVLAMVAAGLVAVVNSADSSQPVVVPPPGVAVEPLPAGAKEWAGKAEATLVSVREQLTVLGNAERAWKDTSRHEDALPEPVRLLIDRRAQLEQQRGRLEADIAAWQAWRGTTTALEETERQLAEIQRQPFSNELQTRLNTLVTLRDQQLRQLAGLRTTVGDAIARPLPDPSDAPALAGAVTSLTKKPTPAPTPTDEFETIEAPIPPVIEEPTSHP